MSRVMEVRAQVAAALHMVPMAQKSLTELEDVLMPELDRGHEEEDFRDKALKAMKAWDKHAMVLERDPVSGRPFMKRYNVNEVQGELEAFAKSLTYGKGAKRKPAPDTSFNRRKT